jgi:cell division septation protein DedD
MISESPQHLPAQQHESTHQQQQQQQLTGQTAHLLSTRSPAWRSSTLPQAEALSRGMLLLLLQELKHKKAAHKQ